MLSVLFLGSDPWLPLGLAELLRTQTDMSFVGGAGTLAEFEERNESTALISELSTATRDRIRELLGRDRQLCVVGEAGRSGGRPGVLVLSRHDAPATVLLLLLDAERGFLHQASERMSPSLSTQEERVLTLFVQGQGIKQVAWELGIANSTVSAYLRRIRIKYTLEGRPAPTKLDLLHRALEDGLVRLPRSSSGEGGPKG